MTQLDKLRAAYKYSSGANRKAIRAMILETECAFANPERAAVADPEPKPREAGVGKTAYDRPGGSSEAKARQSGACGSAVPQSPVEEPTGNPVSHGEGDGSSPRNIESGVGPDSRETAAERTHEAVTAGRDRQPDAEAQGVKRCARCNRLIVGIGKQAALYCLTCSNEIARESRMARARNAGSPERTRACALDGCPNRIPSSSQNKYCSTFCRDEAHRSRARDPEKMIEHRQEPLGRPYFTLPWDSGVIIQRDRPAPRRRYADGTYAPFRDDLNAIADHGSPGMLSRSDDVWRSSTGSALARAI